jgi:hypothetical protein
MPSAWCFQSLTDGCWKDISFVPFVDLYEAIEWASYRFSKFIASHERFYDEKNGIVFTHGEANLLIQIRLRRDKTKWQKEGF